MTGRTWKGGSTTAWRRLRLAVLERDGYICRLRIPGVCTTRATHCDHVVPKSRGGLDTMENCRASCAACNTHRGAGPDPDPPHRPMTKWS
jgi:5-methylcytosine-specific restriction endonuclease McrA